MNQRDQTVTPAKASTSGAEQNNRVGPVIKSGPLADAALAAIEEDNPGRTIHVKDRHAFLRIETDHELVIRRATLERLLGRPFAMQELSQVLASFAGQIESNTEFFRFYFTTTR